jgi:hypothetical protein
MMRELVPGIHHWKTYRDTIGAPVSSYWIEAVGIVIDPMVPEEGLDAFRQARIGPQQVVLTTGLHDRHAERFAEEFSIPIRAPKEAAERIGDRFGFGPYTDHRELAPGVRAVHIGVLCDDEYALHITEPEGAIVVADAVHNYGDTLSFFSDDLLGDDAQEVKRGLKQQLWTLLQRDFEHLLFTHGDPILRHGKRALREFVKSPVEVL